ncbi:MoxR family ATPase [Cellvibrio sp. KY-YJ-3]|uniref:AAA family ATPase n=1 Tax=Cellvibrio sp. KY-YJ-3 TaxID=454662 RepID=UPI001245EE9A|nr:MoxR family ATPase [Cellvibrio sp. KY-YJ-3]QEY14148.1 MoxR family ATPase [Cellvibrio sp. KY-YJ-3]
MTESIHSSESADINLQNAEHAQDVATSPATGADENLQQRLQQASALANNLLNEIKRVLIGQDAIIEQVLIALIARGHVLIEGVPGLGKTLLVRSLAKCFGGQFSRVQFTPDLMPSDVTGHAMFNMAKQEFEIRKGPAFTNLLLADEINRAPAKTQAALLEVMQEGQITIEGESFKTGEPFMVLATQNPVEQEGTYPLPEAELDRFMLKVIIDYPSENDEQLMLRQVTSQAQGGFGLEHIRTLLKPAHVLSLQKIAEQITVDDQILQYVVKLVRATRSWSGIARGAGPRACIALLAAARAYALISNNTFVTPDDVKKMFIPALRHRILLSPELAIEGIAAERILHNILLQVDAPRN